MRRIAKINISSVNQGSISSVIVESREVKETEMSAITDIAQIKWCHIRSIESVQGVEKSNVRFRQVITGELRLRNLFTNYFIYNFTSMKLLTRIFCTDMLSKKADQEESIQKLIGLYSAELKEEAAKIKEIYLQDIEFMNQSHELLKKAMTKLMTIAAERQQSMIALCNENNSITETLLTIQKSQKDIDVQYQKDIEKLRIKTNKQKEFLSISEVSRTSLARDNRQLREELTTEVAKTEVLTAECVRLKCRNAKVESDQTDVTAMVKKRELHNKLQHDEVLIPYRTAQCHTKLYYYTILYYTILYYTILYYTILYYTILYYTILLYPIINYTEALFLPSSSVYDCVVSTSFSLILLCDIIVNLYYTLISSSLFYCAML